jgi:hypothetical protein
VPQPTTHLGRGVGAATHGRGVPNLHYLAALAGDDQPSVVQRGGGGDPSVGVKGRHLQGAAIDARREPDRVGAMPGVRGDEEIAAVGVQRGHRGQVRQRQPGASNSTARACVDRDECRTPGVSLVDDQDHAAPRADKMTGFAAEVLDQNAGAWLRVARAVRGGLAKLDLRQGTVGKGHDHREALVSGSARNPAHGCGGGDLGHRSGVTPVTGKIVVAVESDLVVMSGGQVAISREEDEVIRGPLRSAPPRGLLALSAAGV